MHLFLPYTDNMMQHPTGFVLAGPNIIAFRPVARIVLKGGGGGPGQAASRARGFCPTQRRLIDRGGGVRKP